ncbi:MAG: tetraacyldisaccharide 4'-kinase [Rickettsiales bacterium]|nr:tetraacyldisaccharide 4'-kinase [Rickettsiales bacterium]|tara:strand:+ start:1580 stop:1744 length:165 start_codon:yes stop_codon:yes gene_type:complete
MEKFDENLLKIIVCPKTGKDLVYDKKKNNLRTPDGKNTYKIKNGIPILIIRDSI